MTPSPTAWITFKEACAYSKLGHHTVRRLLYDGELVARQVGRKWIVSRESIDKYLSAWDRETRVAVGIRRR